MSKLTALGVYIFAGGFTVGVSKHFNVLAHFEDGPFGVDTAKLNFPKLPIYTEPATWPVRQFKGKVNFVYANPPCAPWSAVGASLTKGAMQWQTDPRIRCVENAFGVLEAARPDIWVWESVPQAFARGRAMVDALTERAMKLGYAVTYFLTDAQLHGLPQRRQRFHFIAHRVALELPAPDADIVPVKKAIKGLKSRWWPDHPKHWNKLLRNTKQGDGLRETFNKFNPKPKRDAKGHAIGRPVFMNFRLDADLPSPTLIGGCHAVHPTEHRFISPEEHAALCGYPRDFKWAGNKGSIYPQIARAVTPVIGNYLGACAKRAITEGKKIKPEIRVIDYRKLTRTTEGAR